MKSESRVDFCARQAPLEGFLQPAARGLAARRAAEQEIQSAESARHSEHDIIQYNIIQHNIR